MSGVAKMRIVVIGQAAFGEKVVTALLGKGHSICAIFAPPDKQPGKPNSFRDLAKQKNIPFFQPVMMKDPAVYADYTRFAPELNVMAFVTEIIPLNMLRFPPHGTIQYHPSLLPRHRGGSAINWAIIKGETKTGITIFYPDEHIDTGPILLQKETEILPSDTVGSLYFNKLFPLGVDAIRESVELIEQGKARQLPQDEALATSEGLCTGKNAIIDWDKPAKTVFNLIRGCDPQPGAFTFFKGKKLKIYDCEFITATVNHMPGCVLEIHENGILIGLNGGELLIKRVQFEGQSKITATEFTDASGLKAGEQLK
jgi:methionyl-tRNA formyltransferase